MCGRYALKTLSPSLARQFHLTRTAPLAPRYNIAPGTLICAVRLDPQSGQREMVMLHWGLVPHWADDPKIGYRMINARAETAATKPAFKSAMKYRRCLIPADGFFEWRKIGTKSKQPYWITRADEQPFAMAGLWEHWQDTDGNELESCTILTCPANELLADLHDRMPVILDPADHERWLDPATQDASALAPLLKTYAAELMMSRPVSTRVNNVRNDDPACIAFELRRE